MSEFFHSDAITRNDARNTDVALPRAIAILQSITLAWMTVECAVSLYAAARAHSLALLAFGSDSLIELLSALVVLFQFLPWFRLSTRHAEKCAAFLLVALAASIVVAAVLSQHVSVRVSPLGLLITALAIALMPALAALKRRQAEKVRSRVLSADATQSATCAYLAAVTLAGLAINALWHVAWVDRVAALVLIPILIVEAPRTWRGQPCGCC